MGNEYNTLFNSIASEGIMSIVSNINYTAIRFTFLDDIAVNVAVYEDDTQSQEVSGTIELDMSSVPYDKDSLAV